MNKLEVNEKGVKLVQDLIEKAWDDGDFKQQLIASPAATIAKFTETAFNMPANVKIQVQDQTDPNVIYLNIPRKPSSLDIELTDEQLELASGGEVAGVLTGLAVGALIWYIAHEVKN